MTASPARAAWRPHSPATAAWRTTSPLRSARRSAACQYDVGGRRCSAPDSAAARSDIALDAQSARASDQTFSAPRTSADAPGCVTEQLAREPARQERGATLLRLPVRGEPLERAVVRGDRIREATVPKGGRAGCEVVRSIRVHCGDWWKRHG